MADATNTPSRLGRLWRTGRWVLLGLVLAGLGLSYLTRPGVLLPAHFASPMRLSDMPVHIRLAGEDYCLPVNYLDAPLDPGLDQTHLLLRALLPDLEPRNPNTAEEMRRTRGWGRKIGILITAVGEPGAHVERRFETRFNRYGPFARIGRYFDLMVMTTGDGARFGRREIYVDPSGVLPAGFLWCRLPGDVQSPSCQHTFVANDRFVVAASYGRAFLSEWQTIVGRIEDLFEEFRRNQSCYAAPPS